MERAKRESKRVGRPPAIPEDSLVKLVKKYPFLSKRDLWRIATVEGYKISYPRFVRKINEVIKKYNIRREK